MGRRRNGGVLGDLFDIAATLPWWCGMALAVIAYGVLHYYATGNAAGQQVVKAISTPLQYVIPLIFVAGAAASALGRWRRRKRVAEVLGGEAARVIREMKWQEFELLVGEGFRLHGFVVAETRGGGADGGVDLVLQKGRERFFVQCKHWRALKVDVATVRELLGAMAAGGAAGGFVVTSGDFTGDAAAFAKGCNIRLVNGSRLLTMLEKARQTLTIPPRIEPRLAPAKPACPRCSRTMMERIAKQGAQAGKRFWGCPAFPDCRGTLPIA